MKNFATYILFTGILLASVNIWGQTNYTVPSGTATNGLTNPFGTDYNDSRYQYTITKAELTAVGMSANSVITAIAYNVSTSQTHVMNGLTISMKHTTVTNPSSYETGLTQVYTGNKAMSATSWQVLTFQNNFVWNGTDNLLIQVCFDNTSKAANTVQVSYRAPGGNRAIFERSNTAGAVGCNLSSVTTSANIPITRFTVAPVPVATLSNYAVSGTLSTGFANRIGANATPKFTLSGNVASNAVQIELNTASDFSGTAYTTTINDGSTYTASTLYDFWTTQTLPAGDRTYFVRARLSNDAGSIWGPWTTQLWPYSYYSSTPYIEEGWYYTTQEQFNTGTVQENTYDFISVQNNESSYPDDDYFILDEGAFSINAGTGDGVRENGTWYSTQTYMTIGWQNNCNGNAAIYNGFPFVVNIPQAALIKNTNFSVVATTDCPCEDQTKALRLIFDAHDVDDGATLTSANVLSLTVPARTTANQVFLYNATWTNDTRYVLTPVTNILQAIVNRAGWSAGHTFNLMGRWDAGYSAGS
ncbi:MAG TPA: hypothetical protein PLP27_01640, partial [Crocinitomicaceae bacterium]|nr:hypothetical protein [Crocinitomicaceae bacterium]